MSHRFLAAIVVAALGTIAPSTHANTITVCLLGCDYASINSAIAAADDGDVIQLAAGTYLEGSVIDTNGKAITLRGAITQFGTPATILDGGRTHQVLQCISGETSETVFETHGFRLLSRMAEKAGEAKETITQMMNKQAAIVGKAIGWTSKCLRKLPSKDSVPYDAQVVFCPSDKKFNPTRNRVETTAQEIGRAHV